MSAIFKRDFRAFFTTPLGYIFCGVFLLFTSLIFTLTCIFSGTSDMSGVFQWMLLIMIFLMPVLTMRLLSEEKKLKTDQALLTAPVGLYSVVFAKFLAAVCVFLTALVTTLIFPLIIALRGNPQPAIIIGNYIGVFLFAASFTAVGLFISSITENQFVSGVVSMFVFLVIMFVLDYLPEILPAPLNSLAGNLSFNQRYIRSFGVGVFNIADALFYLSIAAIFVFLTVRVLEKRRYS